MKVEPLLKNIKSKTFLKDYLKACGVEDIDEYLTPDDSCFDNPWDYPNMDKAVERLKEAIDNKEQIGVVVD